MVESHHHHTTTASSHPMHARLPSVTRCIVTIHLHVRPHPLLSLTVLTELLCIHVWSTSHETLCCIALISIALSSPSQETNQLSICQHLTTWQCPENFLNFNPSRPRATDTMALIRASRCLRNQSGQLKLHYMCQAVSTSSCLRFRSLAIPSCSVFQRQPKAWLSCTNPVLSDADAGYRTRAPYTYEQGQTVRGRREYFYYIDHNGFLFLDDVRICNFTSCFKDREFLDFFFNRLRKNDAERHEELFPWISRCGRELNFLRCDDTPIGETTLCHIAMLVVCFGCMQENERGNWEDSEKRRRQWRAIAREIWCKERV
eukprot:m.224930 g.224930  ORF g.224930 m.224930 type:complete len:316 (-) comp15155_c0_seq4:2620-3567(-)